MTYKEAIEILRPMADNYVLPGVVDALETAIRAMEDLPKVREELADERNRHDRYVDYATERDKLFDQLLADFRASANDELCHYCKHWAEPLPCEGADYVCYECSIEGCMCRDCRDYENWEWRGKPEVQNG